MGKSDGWFFAIGLLGFFLLGMALHQVLVSKPVNRYNNAEKCVSMYSTAEEQNICFKTLDTGFVLENGVLKIKEE